MSNSIIKDFNFDMPLIKGYDADDGYYHIKFAISSNIPDLQGDLMEKEALEDMVKQAKGINYKATGELQELAKTQGISIDDSHMKGLKSIIGPVTNSWIEKEDNQEQVWVDLRVRKEWEDTIKDLVDSGVALGGSIQGKATKIVKDVKTGLRKIKGVRIVKAALTDIPAAWDTRGTAQAIEKACPMCAQIFKSIDNGFKIEKEAQTMELNEDDSYESLREKVSDAINEKYTVGDNSRFYVRNTWPDAVIARDWNQGKNYAIPYSIDDNGVVTLGEPKEASNQWIEKMAEFYEEMFKNIRGDNLTDIEIPEGVDLDKSIAEKIKSQGEKGKEFIKGLLGIEETEPKDPDKSTEPGDPGGVTVNKDVNMEDIQKMIDKSNEPLKKEIETLKSENEDLKKSNEDLKKDAEDSKKDKASEIHKGLVKDALDLTKTYDEDTEVKDEEALLKHLEEDKTLAFDKEVLKEDPDACLKIYNMAMRKALEKTPEGDLVNLDDETIQKQADKYAAEEEELRKELDEQGRG